MSPAMAAAKTVDGYPLSGHHAKFRHFFKKKLSLWGIFDFYARRGV